MTIVDSLRVARKMIERPEAWTRGWFARTATGDEVSAYDRKAVCWCSSGAMARVGAEARAYAFLARAMDGDIASFNDTSTHAEVLTAFDRAIVIAETTLTEIARVEAAL
jgi:hypothetical protein